MTKTFDKPLHANQHCRHYSYNMVGAGMSNTIQGPCCAKGIGLSMPGSARVCMPPLSFPANNLSCTERQEYTTEEREAWDVWKQASFKRMILVMTAIPGRDDDKKCWGKQGTLACPACDGGTVRWTRASVNGHLWAACSTPNCFSVIQ